MQGFRKLKYADFATSYSITGTFLRNLGNGGGGSLLEVLILRDCMHLKEMEVARFLTAVIAGDFKFLKHLDISNREGLASEGDWYQRSYNSSLIPLQQVLEVRPDICLLAEFPSEGCFLDIDHMIDSDINSELSLPFQQSGQTSDGALVTSSLESSYNSDQGSGNEEYQDSGFVIYEESSDEVDFLIV
ncbi:hypothetical protein Gohar_007539 [Gossypium harknessii]|uniref:Uncharacterized protein n=2 Tax=Gossypium TaxID=3633 RepID=A0A7J9IZL9_9ROSI|nr:hypothetical protein [Gossypium harknessii]MBA0827014.1 hypothetical protein [Gossypium armourianum]